MKNTKRFFSLFLALVMLVTFNTSNKVLASSASDFKVIIKNRVKSNEGKYARGAKYDVLKTYDYASDGNYKKLAEPKIIHKDIEVNEEGKTLSIPEKGVYEVIQTQRAPGYYLAGTKDELYRAVIEFPRMDKGIISSDQTANVVPKLDPVLVDINLFKKGEDTKQENNGLNDVTFDLIKTHDEFMRKFEEPEMLSKGLKTSNGGFINLQGLPEGIYELIEVGVSKIDGTDNDKIYADPEGTHLIDNRPLRIKVTTNEEGTEDLVELVDEDGKTISKLNKSESKGVSDLKIIYELTKDNYRVPEITKKVNGKDTFNTNIGKEFEYTISTKIPTNIKDYKKFQIFDKMDTRLTYIKDSVEVLIENNSVANEKLFDTLFDESSNELIVSVKDSDLLDMYKGQNLTIKFKAKLNMAAEAGSAVPNRGQLKFDTGTGVIKEKQSNLTTVNPQEGSIKVIKVDKADPNTKLSGAVFILRDAVTQAIAKDVNGEEFRGVTDGNGEVIFSKVPFGDYELVEEKAPIGYLKTTEVNRVKLDENSPSLEYKFVIENEKLTGTPDPENPIDPVDPDPLPETGVDILGKMIVSGLLLLAIGILVKQKENKQ